MKHGARQPPNCLATPPNVKSYHTVPHEELWASTFRRIHFTMHLTGERRQFQLTSIWIPNRVYDSNGVPAVPTGLAELHDKSYLRARYKRRLQGDDEVSRQVSV